MRIFSTEYSIIYEWSNDGGRDLGIQNAAWISHSYTMHICRAYTMLPTEVAWTTNVYLCIWSWFQWYLWMPRLWIASTNTPTFLINNLEISHSTVYTIMMVTNTDVYINERISQILEMNETQVYVRFVYNVSMIYFWVVLLALIFYDVWRIFELKQQHHRMIISTSLLFYHD